MYTFLPSWPLVSTFAEDIREFHGRSPLGLDLEFDNKGRPTILGLSDGQRHVSVAWADGREYLLELLHKYPQTVLVGHNIVGADLQVLANVGIRVPLAQVEDTIIRHWLTNMHLSKATGKAALEEDADEKRGRGFNNLWTMASIYTDFPHWKDCRGEPCSGPCPDHSPYWYNGLDAAAPVLALAPLKKTMALRGIEQLYGIHRDLAGVLAEMREFGVRADVPYIGQLRKEFERDKEAIGQTLPFNADSHKQVLEYFRLTSPLTRESGAPFILENNQEETIREAVEELGEENAPEELLSLLEYKELGNGPDRWFKPQYVDEHGYIQGFMDEWGYIHPHLSYFTSSGRLMCSGPNLQNVSKRRRSRKICECGHRLDQHNHTVCSGLACFCLKFKGESIGKKVRRAFIAPDGWYMVRADLSNAENRVVLHLAGYQIARGVDLHRWVQEMAGLTPDMEICKVLGGPRDAAKSIQHAANILEGLQLKEPGELRGKRTRAEIDAGARVVFPRWTFRGKIVTFTGVNLARRAFGSATYENRRKALEITEKYFARFPKIREFQQRVSRQCEMEHIVRPPHGYTLLSFGPDEDRMKTAQGVWQQQPVAHVTKLALLKLWARWKRDARMRPVLQVHDEVICYARQDVPPDVAKRWLIEDMEIETPEIPGMIIPADASHGPNWRDQK